MSLNMGNFQAIKENAKKIMDMDRSGALNQYKGMAGENFDTINLGAENPTVQYNMQEMQQYQQYQQPIMLQEQRQGVRGNSRLPKAILESMESNPIDETPLYDAIGSGSVLDKLDKKTFENSRRLMPNAGKVPTKITEQIQQPQQIVTQSANIDYSLIKTIVEDCVKKSMVALKKNILNENANASSNALMYMQFNNGFKFITKNGDIYEAKLIKKGNVNDKG